MALVAYMEHYNGQKWFTFTGPGGNTVTERAVFECKARRAASDRLGCDESELICTGSTPVRIDYKIIGK